MASYDAVLCLSVILRDTFFHQVAFPQLLYQVLANGLSLHLSFLYKDWLTMPEKSEVGAKIHTLLSINKHMGCLMMLCFDKWANLTSSGKWTG